MVLLEIPTQVSRHATERTSALTGRLEELRLSHPDDAEIADIEYRLSEYVQCKLTWSDERHGCTIARIFKVVDAFPDTQEVAVEFAMCRDNELKIQCLRTPPHLPKLPACIPVHPRTVEEATSKARSLVIAAIRLVDGEYGRWCADAAAR
jgi:hypothetical protein